MYYVPGTALGTKDLVMGRTDDISIKCTFTADTNVLLLVHNTHTPVLPRMIRQSKDKDEEMTFCQGGPLEEETGT